MNTKDILIQDTMKKSFMRYSMTVILSRALPDARDGFKPVHRRVVYGMLEKGVLPGKPYMKSAKIVGEVMGSLHPHGDSSIYDSLVRMAQPFSLRYPLVDGQGNFGNLDGSPAAAMRYTESRMNKASAYMIRDINRNTVDFKPNYDDSTTEPTVLPSVLPNLLVNGSIGIAIGMATNMAPHNLNEVAGAIRCYIEKYNRGEEVSIDDLLPFLTGPDFPTGGEVCGTSGFIQAMRTGRGKLTIRAKYHIEKTKSGRDRMVVTELPYLTNMLSLVAKIKEVHLTKKVEGISDIRDESSKDVRIVIDLKKDANTEVVVNQLLKTTDLQCTFNYNNMAIDEGKPKLLNILDLVRIYVEHRHEVVQRRAQFDHDKAAARANILEGFTKAQANIEAVVKDIRTASDQNAAKELLKKNYLFSDLQVDAIVAMRLGQLTALDASKIAKELEDTLASIADLLNLLGDKTRRMLIVLSELEEVVSDLGDQRKTIINADTADIEDEDLIPDDDMVVTLSKEGYIKRVPLADYRSQGRGGVGVKAANLKDDDYITTILQATNKSYLMVFTTSGRAYRIKVWSIPEGTRGSKGRSLVNLIETQEGEKVSAVVVVPKYEEGKYLIYATKDGLINKMDVMLFSNLRKGGINAINIREDDELISVLLADESSNFMLSTAGGIANNFLASGFRATGRGSTGVKGISLGFGDRVIGMVALEEGSTIITLTKNGIGKRTRPDDYREAKRGGKGVKNITVSNKTGPVVFVAIVHEGEELIVTTQDGTILRTPINDITVLSRSATGSRILRLREGDEVVDAAVISEAE